MGTPTRTRRLWALTAVLVAMVAALLGACSTDGDDDAGFATGSSEASDDGGSATDGGREAAAASDDGAAGDDAAGDGGGDDGAMVVGDDAASDGSAEAGEPVQGGGTSAVPAGLQPVDIGRDIVFTAVVAIEVDDVTAASRQALGAVERLGGFLFGQDTGSDGTSRTVLVFKVAPADFQEALNDLGGIGTIRSQQVSASDVTDRIVDLESRIITAEASVERLRTFLAGATTVEAVASLERELLQRETDLETLRGQLRSLESQVSLATITLTITQAQARPEITLVQSAYAGHDGGATCPGDDRVDADEGAEVSVCLAVTNSGTTHLDGVDVTVDALDIDTTDLTVVEGDPTAVLAPGERLVWVYETTLDDDLWVSAVVSADPVDATGQTLGLAQVTGRSTVDLNAESSDALPGFLDGLKAGAGAMAQVLGVIVLALGVVLPFLWLVPLGAAVVWLVRRRRPARRSGEVVEPAA